MAIISCATCDGTGTIGDPPKCCPKCRGKGEYDTDWVSILRTLGAELTVLNDKLDNIFEKVSKVPTKSKLATKVSKSK